jgi:uncharacterized lipoprotein YehR (DUF1307 family)
LHNGLLSFKDNLTSLKIGKKMKKLLVIISALLMLSLLGCGSKLNGTYSWGNVGDPIRSSYTFESGGKVIQETMGMKIEMKYELNGKDIKIITPQATMILTLVDENTITGPMGIKFVKSK